LLPLQAKQYMISSLPHHEHELQRTVINVSSRKLGNEGIAWLFNLITELLTTLIGKNTTYESKYMDSKIIIIANGKTCKKRLLDVEKVILIRYYYHAAKTRAL